MSRTSRGLSAACGGALALMLAVVPAAGAAGRPGGGVAPRDARAVATASAGPKPFFDVRAPALRTGSAPGAASPRALPAEDRAARGRLVARLGGQAILNADPITATPRALGRLDGTLTGPKAGDPGAIALGYVRAHAGALGLAAGDLASLRESRRTTVGGVTYVRWRQEVRGIPVLDNDLRASVDGDGRVVAVLGAPRPGVDVDAASAAPALTAAEAFAAVARNVGADRQATVTSGPTGPRAETTFSTGDRASLVRFGDTGSVRLAWQLTYRAGPDAWYAAVVDATSGTVLRRANMTHAVTGRVFDNYPGAAVGGTQRLATLDPYLTPGATTLSGPFAHAWSDIDDTSATPGGETPQPAEEVAPGEYPFSEVTAAANPAGECDAAHRCSWQGDVPSSWEGNRRQNAVQVFWYVNRFHDHLADAPIGFDAASDNFEGADAVRAETDDGAAIVDGIFPDATHVNNANMTTLPEGQAPVMEMYLFLSDGTPTAPFRDVNGGDDGSVVYHEYTHGLSNRLITDAVGTSALNAVQSAAMGEGWSDFYAKDFLVNQFPQTDTAADGEVDMGAYVDARPNRIRTQPLDCSVGSLAPLCPGTAGAGGPGGYTYGDFAKILGGAEVHADGEIWGETLWDLRRALGSTVTETIVTGGMRISPTEPSFLEMRDAILLADSASFAGAHTGTIWTVFARRGMGVAATTTGATDTTPVEDFTTPPSSAAPAAPAPAPAGGATPQSVAAPPGSAVARAQARSRPTGRVDRSGVRGRATFTVGCSSACSATATMTVTRATARRVGLGTTTRVARVTRRIAGPARRTFALALSSTTLRRLRAKSVPSLPVRVAVAIRDSSGQTRSVRRTVSIRIR